MSQASGDGNTSARDGSSRGVLSYKQLQADLETTQKKLKAMIQLAEKTKLSHAQQLVNTMEEAKKKNEADWSQFEAEREERERIAEAAREKQRIEDAERLARETELQVQKRVNEVLVRTTSLYENKFNEIRSELLLLQRAHDDLQEQHKSLLEWQKVAVVNQSNWQELKKSMQIEVNEGKVAAANLARYKTILKYMACHKYVKDVKLKKRLLPLHVGCSKLVALILKDDDLRERLLHQQAELARWVSDAHMVEKSEGITSELPVAGLMVPNTTQPNPLPTSASQRQFMMNTNVEYLVASLIEVEHVLSTCVATILRYNTHFKTTSSGFFERNVGLTAHCMAVEKECRETKEKNSRIQSQLSSTLALLSRLEVKYSQLSRKLGKEDRMLAHRYLQRHGITTTTTNEDFEDRLTVGTANPSPHGSTDLSDINPSNWNPTGSRPRRKSLQPDPTEASTTQPLALPPGNNGVAASAGGDNGEDLSLLSPRALLKKLHPTSPTIPAPSSRRQTVEFDSSNPIDFENKVQTPRRTRRRPATSETGRQLQQPDTFVTQTRESPERVPWGRHQTSRPNSSPSTTLHHLKAEPLRPVSRTQSHQVPSAASASIAYSSSAITAGLNLATTAPQTALKATQPTTHILHSKSSRPNTVKRKPPSTSTTTTAGGTEKKTVNVYESSSEDEFTVHPVSITPPPSTSAIRAVDFEDGDKFIKVDGVTVELDHVPTIAEAMRQHRQQHRQRRSKKKKKFAGDQKEGDNQSAATSIEPSPMTTPAVRPQTESITSSPLVLPALSSDHGEEKEQLDLGETSAPRSSSRVTNHSLIPKTTTTWNNKLAAAQTERQAKTARSNSSISDPHLVQTSSKSRLAEHSPYQDHVKFGTGSGAGGSTSSLTNAETKSSTTRHATDPALPTHTQRRSHTIVPSLADGNKSARAKFKPTPPPSSSGSASARPNTSSATSSARSHVIHSVASPAAQPSQSPVRPATSGSARLRPMPKSSSSKKKSSKSTSTSRPISRGVVALTKDSSKPSKSTPTNTTTVHFPSRPARASLYDDEFDSSSDEQTTNTKVAHVKQPPAATRSISPEPIQQPDASDTPIHSDADDDYEADQDFQTTTEKTTTTTTNTTTKSDAKHPTATTVPTASEPVDDYAGEDFE